MNIRLIFHIIVWSCLRSKSTLYCPNVNRKVKIYVEPITYTKHQRKMETNPSKCYSLCNTLENGKSKREREREIGKNNKR